jgi:hypothetical protein
MQHVSGIMVMELVVIHICSETMVAWSAITREKIKLLATSIGVFALAAHHGLSTHQIQVRCIMPPRIGYHLRLNESSKSASSSNSH